MACTGPALTHLHVKAKCLTKTSQVTVKIGLHKEPEESTSISISSPRLRRGLTIKSFLQKVRPYYLCPKYTIWQHVTSILSHLFTFDHSDAQIQTVKFHVMQLTLVQRHFLRHKSIQFQPQSYRRPHETRRNIMTRTKQNIYGNEASIT